jgi:4-amino-4-deoxy-L-arabinose transferase-like glycosyltransferase
VLRLVVAAAAPLAPDEAYYWVWSRALAPGYLDHPPVVALFAWAGTALAGDTPLGIRLLAPLSAALGTMLLVQAGEDLLPGRGAGRLAALLLNATLLFGVGAVTMTPDTPVLFFWTATLWALGRLVATGQGRWWLAAGALLGLAFDSKYTAFLLAAAIPLWLLMVPAMRPWLLRWQAWAGGGLAVALFLPVVAWNAAHGWASFAKQGGRTGAWNPGRAAQYLGELLLGQLGLATPLIAVLCAAGMVLAVRRLRLRAPGWTLLAAVTALPALVFVQHAFGDRVQANWPAVLYPGAAIAAAGLGAGWRRLVRPGVALGFAMTALAWAQGAAAPFALPMRLDPTLLRLGGWSTLAGEIETARKAAGAGFVVSDNYSHAALLSLLLPRATPVYGLEDRWRLFALPHDPPAARAGLLVRSARRDAAPAGEWERIVPLGEIDRARGGMTAERFRLYRVEGRAGDTPIAAMPRPR